MSSKIRVRNLLLIYLIVTIILIVLSIASHVSLSLGVVFIIFMTVVIYCFGDLKNRAALLVFMMSFFIFMLGGEMTNQYFGLELENQFSEEINNHTYITLIISLIAVTAGFITAGFVELGRNPKSEYLSGSINNKSTIMLIRQIGLVGTYITFVPTILMVIDAGLYVMRNGYVSYYTSYRSSLPVVVVSLGQMFTMCFFIYVATMPQKKKCSIPIIMYLIYGALGLLTGRRLLLGTTVLVIVYYMILRHKMNPHEGWITRRRLIIGVTAVFALVIFMYTFKYMRYERDVEGTGFLDMFLRFFNQQGVSVDVIKYQKLFEGDELGCVSLYYTLRYLRTSLLTRPFSSFPRELYSMRSLNTALYTNNLADYIAYNINPRSYYAGYGYGTSYIAEAYHDLGYLGVGLVSFIYGWILNKLYSFKNGLRSIWSIVIGFMILEKFVAVPRYSVDYLLNCFYNLANMAALICIMLFVWIKSTNTMRQYRNTR